jgi:hypothetical protein
MGLFHHKEGYLKGEIRSKGLHEMRIIEQLVYKITGDNSEFDKSIDKSETKVSKFGSVADKMLAGVTVAAIGMVVKKMGDMVISSANALDRVDKLSQKIGLSRVAFQEWDYILGQSGASVEGLQMGLSFNPRTRGGCDCKSRRPRQPDRRVSIHAPAGGATG